MSSPVRTRIAPAPSGYIHVGNARTALYNWLFTRRHGGTFVLRVEDTDAKRVSEEGYEGVLEDLRWLGLDWDEGPEVGGPFGPYRQSERFERYDAVARQLLDKGRAYRCYCTPEEVAERRKAKQRRAPPGYDGHCRRLSAARRAALEAEGRPSALRFAVPEGRTVEFDDIVRGAIVTASDQIADFVIKRSDGSPTYLLAAGVDDALMNITHVIRGDDLMAATPRQLLLREAMGVVDSPRFAHLPQIVDARGRPLSKRWGDVAVKAYRKQGFLPEAIINYLALLGWSYDDRTNIFSRDELVSKFSLERVGRNPAAFDVAKLEWLNGHYIRQLSPERLARELEPLCVAAGLPASHAEGRRKLSAVAPLLLERLKRLDEAPPMIRFLFETPSPDDRARRALEGQQDYLAAVTQAVEPLEKWTASAIEEALRGLAERRALKPKQAFQPIRAAVTGTLVSPPLFESLEILGREATLERLRAAASTQGRSAE
jgi:glutamyl-tRNA synthetase